LFHLVLWRLRLPRRHTPALLVIFFGALPIALALAALVPSLRPWLPASAWDYLLLVSFHVPLSLAYVAFYSAIEADSPSCLIAALVARAGGAGCTREELAGAMGDEEVLKRVPGMAGFGFAEERGGQLRLLPRGRLLVRFYTALDAILGLGAGG
ncbi:MAG TPA: hypothetical protein VN317_07215, partial [Candidatus Methanoperedens sp.]|nr:hypothetical protein [Candidatus Methanoperedens sp.]